jgi:hypothetical protein
MEQWVERERLADQRLPVETTVGRTILRADEGARPKNQQGDGGQSQDAGAGRESERPSRAVRTPERARPRVWLQGPMGPVLKLEPRNDHTQHGKQNEDHPDRYGELKQGFFDATPGSVDRAVRRVALRESRATRLHQDEADKKNRDEDLRKVQIDQ